MLIKTKPKYLIAVSGGPDSIFLLNLYKNKNIVVAFVNYNIRQQAIQEQNYVLEFCKENQIPCEILSINIDKSKGNFQDLARKSRYEFFAKVYKSYKCNYLLTGHHKDDFIETVMLQKNKHKIVNYWGIARKSQNFGIQIYRPLIYKKFKNQIVKFLQKNNIKFFEDQSNFEPIYERNKIRADFAKKSIFYKQFFLWKYQFLNLFKTTRLLWWNFQLNRWEKNNYKCDFLNKIKQKKTLIYFFIQKNFENVNLTENKIQSIIGFVLGGKPNGVFVLDSSNSIIKKHNFLSKSSKIL